MKKTGRAPCFCFHFHYIIHMDAVRRAAEALRKTEALLRDLVSEAAKAGDYPSVLQLASWAKAVGELVEANPDSHPSVATKLVTARRTVTKPKKKTQNGYPRFYRQNDSVVKIARSKRQQGEYQHKAPYTVLLALADAMAKAGDEGRVFSTDDFLPIEVGGVAVPAYQAYLGIALFKQLGLIDQHGRQGYSIPRLDEFKDGVSSVWKKLPAQ